MILLLLSLYATPVYAETEIECDAMVISVEPSIVDSDIIEDGEESVIL